MDRKSVAAVILAAGKGTRLAPLTLFRPKAFCPVNNVPLVDIAIARAESVTSAVAVNVHHGRHLLEPHLADRVHLSIEEIRPLGTAGALGALRGWIAGRPVLVLNADSWHRAPLEPFVDGWQGDRMRLLAVAEAGPADFGNRRYTGACLMPWETVSRLAAEPAGLYERCWRPAWEEGRLEFVEAGERFIDCGTLPSYLAANLAASGGQSVIGPGAIVHGEVIRSVVWPGGIVRQGERLVESVRVGAGVTVEAHLSASS